MKFIEELDLENKKVLLRLDLNVTIKDNEIVDDTKIKKSLKTIQYLIDHKCKILIMSHLGKIKSEEDKKNNSLRIVCQRLSNYLGKEIAFLNNPNSKNFKEVLNKYDLVLMENTRYMDLVNKGESSCDINLAKKWASSAEVFINDAFGTSHRRHASNYGISSLLTSGYGYLIKEEMDGLKPIISEIKRPFTVVMGGAKVDDKVQLIESLLKECDTLVVGGGIANTFLVASGVEIGDSLYSADYVGNVKNIIEKYRNKILLPIDVTVENSTGDVLHINTSDIQKGYKIYDVGPKTIKLYSDKLKKSETIFVNGTMGMYENPLYADGTKGLLKTLSKIDAIKIAGGGDAVSSVNKLNYKDAFTFLSTGGGASLEYIADKELKCFTKNKQ